MILAINILKYIAWTLVGFKGHHLQHINCKYCLISTINILQNTTCNLQCYTTIVQKKPQNVQKTIRNTKYAIQTTKKTNLTPIGLAVNTHRHITLCVLSDHHVRLLVNIQRGKKQTIWLWTTVWKCTFVQCWELNLLSVSDCIAWCISRSILSGKRRFLFLCAVSVFSLVFWLGTQVWIFCDLTVSDLWKLEEITEQRNWDTTHTYIHTHTNTWKD